MHKAAYGARLQVAQERIEAAVMVMADEELAQKVAQARHRDKHLMTLFKLEAVAEVLEQVAGVHLTALETAAEPPAPRKGKGS